MKKIVLFFLIMSLSVSSVFAVSNEKSVTFDNDGSAIAKPYGDSGINPSFDGEYYDCYIPYKLTCKDVGGHATTMSDDDQYKAISSKFNWENDDSDYFSENYAGSYTSGHDKDTGVTTYTGSDGTVFFLCAIPYFMYANNRAGSSGFPGWGIENRGQVFDVILTNGTVIHFVVGDAKSKSHTNGCEDGTSPYDLSEVVYPQYQHLFQAQAGETFELFGKSGCTSKFMKKYNIGTGDGKNQVAYVRMYNLRLKDGEVRRKENIPDGADYALGTVSISSGSVSASSDIIPEYLLTGMPNLPIFSESMSSVGTPSRGDLSIKEQYSLQSTKDLIDARNTILILDVTRHILVFCGLMLFSYSIMLVLAYVFDNVNSFIDISMLSLLTLGSMKVHSKDDSVSSEEYSSRRKLYISIGSLFAISCLMISGAVVPGIMRVLYWVFSLFR